MTNCHGNYCLYVTLLALYKEFGQIALKSVKCWCCTSLNTGKARTGEEDLPKIYLLQRILIFAHFTSCSQFSFA